MHQRIGNVSIRARGPVHSKKQQKVVKYLSENRSQAFWTFSREVDRLEQHNSGRKVTPGNLPSRESESAKRKEFQEYQRTHQFKRDTAPAKHEKKNATPGTVPSRESEAPLQKRKKEVNWPSYGDVTSVMEISRWIKPPTSEEIRQREADRQSARKQMWLEKLIEAETPDETSREVKNIP